MSVHVYSSSEELSAAAAREFAARAEEAIEERGRFAVVLAGGSTPETMYGILARDYMDRIDWSRVYVFFGDERSVPPHHEDSNHKMASEVLLDHVPVGNVHRMRGELPPEEAAEAYEEELRTFFQTEDVPRFDLILLGIGADGHTASLFPETSAHRGRRPLGRGEPCAQAGYHPHHANHPRHKRGAGRHLSRRRRRQGRSTQGDP